MKLTNLIAPMTMLAVLVPAGVSAEELSLTFQRSGLTAATVSVAASGITGAQASLTSVSHALRTDVASSVVCPNVNGSTSPNISFEIIVTGLPSSFKYDQMGIDIHALNGNGGYQKADDNVTRQWNVSISSGASSSLLQPFASLNDIDIAANINSSSTERHKVWDFNSSETYSAMDPLIIRISVSKGTTNGGCFFGISKITLSSLGEEPEPDPNIFTIKWKNSTSSYMAEMPGGGLEIVDYAPTSRIFWEFIPTGNTNCYYIRNCATGNYIGTCNYEPGSTSKISMSGTPVEYYMGTSASTSGENKGCVWFSSTDCANYSRESSSARCLNKDGASQSIITWTTGISNKGSYWTCTPSANLYEPQPFTPASAIGQATAYYQIVNQTGLALTHSLSWKKRENVSDQKWYFVGISNAAGGYLIVDASTNEAINNGVRYKIVQRNGYYEFADSESEEILSFDGETLFSFAPIAADRTLTSLFFGLYSMPCGSLSDTWFTVVESGKFRYPLPVLTGDEISYPEGQKPSSKYTIFTHNELTYGSEVNATLNHVPTSGTRIAVYFDWDCDGVFEDMRELPLAKTITFTVSRSDENSKNELPEHTRMRLKVTDNGLMDADDDVNGHVMDFKVNCSEGQLKLPTVSVNARNRGKATIDADARQAIATAKGTSAFVCWKEGHTFISTQSTMDVEESTSAVHYTAVFSPNLDDDDDDGDETAIVNIESDEISVRLEDDRTIRVESPERVRKIYVFTLNGSVAKSCSDRDSLSLSELESGVYIVKAVGLTGTDTIKVVL